VYQHGGLIFMQLPHLDVEVSFLRVESYNEYKILSARTYRRAQRHNEPCLVHHQDTSISGAAISDNSPKWKFVTRSFFLDTKFCISETFIS
jgi:hypothetical protein